MQGQIWHSIISPNGKNQQQQIWIGKVLLTIWQYHWICHFNNTNWRKKVALTTSHSIMKDRHTKKKSIQFVPFSTI
jgi:hypothetical protein